MVLEPDVTGAFGVDRRFVIYGAAWNDYVALCYCVGTMSRPRPDLAIEVVTSRSGIDKLRVYEGLGVPEGYETSRQSLVLEGFDPVLFGKFVERVDQTRAVERYRAAVKKTRRS